VLISAPDEIPLPRLDRLASSLIQSCGERWGFMGRFFFGFRSGVFDLEDLRGGSSVNQKIGGFPSGFRFCDCTAHLKITCHWWVVHGVSHPTC